MSSFSWLSKSTPLARYMLTRNGSVRAGVQSSWLGGIHVLLLPAISPSATFAWRFPRAFPCLPPLVLLAGSFLVPFSPRWLLQQGRREEALEIVMQLHQTPEDKNHIKARQEFYLTEKQYELDRQLQVRPLEIFRTAANRTRCLVAFLLM